jgi:two-component system phosphate regulon sensor histidine kinase PhoR
MFRNFRWKLTGSYLLLILLLLIIAGGLVFGSFKSYYLQNLELRLTREAYLIADMVKYIEPDKTNAYQDICATASRDSATRVSIIDQNGVVLGDSEFDTRKLDIHKSRPEVYQALHGKVGVATRYSNTEKINMLYVAVPFANQVQSGVIRMAMPLSELTAMYQRILMLMLFALLVSAVLAVLLSLLMAKRFSEPLHEITTVVQDMAGGNLKRRISPNQGIDELRLLAGAYNDMAENIEQGVSDLNEVKNRLEAVLNNTVNGILMVDAEGKISYANPAALVLLGMQADIIGHNKTEVIKNYAILETIDQVKSELKPVRNELMLHHLGGKTVEINIVPILNAARTNQGVLVVLNDISELKKLEQVRKDFVANVSHELKTPVAVISGFAETLLDEGGGNPATVMEFSRIIYDEAQRLTSLINGLLELSRLESEKAEVNILSVDIDKVLRSTLMLAQRQPNSQKVTLEYIPAASQPVIASDADLIVQVISNLLDNAIKYSPEGGQIQLQLEELDDMVKINVIDTGLGIPEIDIPRIFERFYRVDKARSRKTGGSGLGLAIVKHLVEILGGQVTVESKLEEGSVFSVILPKNENLISGQH